MGYKLIYLSRYTIEYTNIQILITSYHKFLIILINILLKVIKILFHKKTIYLCIQALNTRASFVLVAKRTTINTKYEKALLFSALAPPCYGTQCHPRLGDTSD